MFTMLSGIRLNSCNRPYLGSISSNLNPHGFARHNRIPGGCSSSSAAPPFPPAMPWFPHLGSSSSSSPAAGGGGAVSHFGGRRSSTSGDSGGQPSGCTGGGGGKIRALEIVLDKESRPVFEPGQEVAGKVIITCIGNLKFRSLAVSMRGVARVHWTEGGQGVYSMTFNEEVEYFNKKRYIVSAQSSGECHVLSEGSHAFEFRFCLPTSADLVTSFEGKFGSVRYFMRADLDQPWSFTHRAKKAFTLISPVDINTPEQLTPVSKEGEKTVCCCFLPWKTGEVGMTVSTDRKGYCPGESVALDALFCNRSNRRIRPEAALVQLQTFTAGGKSRRKLTTLTALAGQSVRAGEELTWDSVLLKIPAVSPTIANCGFIRVEYSVRVTLGVPGACDLSLSLPIVVGTVPYQQQQQQQLRASAASLAVRMSANRCLPPPAASSSTARPITPAPPYPEGAEDLLGSLLSDPPPSYRECMDEEAAVDIADEADFTETASLYGERRFVPLYRYVTDYHPPPAYAEEDPFPFPPTTGGGGRGSRHRQQQQQQHRRQHRGRDSNEISLQDQRAIGRGPRDSI